MKHITIAIPTPSDAKRVATNYYAGVKARRQAKRDAAEIRQRVLDKVADEIIKQAGAK